MAKLYFRYGAMGSSKTANALMVWFNYKEKGQVPVLLKIQDWSGRTLPLRRRISGVSGQTGKQDFFLPQEEKLCCGHC